VPTTPKREKRSPTEPGARFLTDAIATNVRDRRALQHVSQKTLGKEMKELGHPWTDVTVSEVENGWRNVTAVELVGLALLLNCELVDLVDPVGVAGRGVEPIDDLRFGKGRLGAVGVHHWLHGNVRVQTEGTNYISVDRVGDEHEQAYKETRDAFKNAIPAQPVGEVPPPPRRDVDRTKSRKERKKKWST
jgi:hypothetical protein